MEAVRFSETHYASAHDSTSNGHSDASPAVRKFDHVLVPLDGSDFSLAAMATARALAERFGAELHTIDVDSGDPGARIADRAHELGASVVCLSTRPRGRIAGTFLHSLASDILRRSDRPIVAVGPMAERPGWDPEPQGWSMPLSAGAIIACVDGTGESEMVLSEAAPWARALGKSLEILTVIDDTPEPLRARPGTIHPRTRSGAEDYVDALVARWAAPGIEVAGLVLRDPIGPASAIRKHLARRPAALVALVAPDRSGLHRLRRGATAEEIVRASSAPCLLIPATANTEGE